MRKFVLIIVMVVFSLGIIHAQEEAKKEQNAKIDWGFSVGVGTGSLDLEYQPGSAEPGYTGYEAGVTAEYQKFLFEGSVEHFSKDLGGATTSWESFMLKSSYLVTSWAYLGISYGIRPARTEYDYGYTAKGTMSGLGFQGGLKFWKGLAIELRHSSFLLKQDHFDDSKGEINQIILKYFF